MPCLQVANWKLWELSFIAPLVHSDTGTPYLALRQVFLQVSEFVLDILHFKITPVVLLSLPNYFKSSAHFAYGTLFMLLREKAG